MAYRLVHEVPYVSALELRVFSYEVPVFLESPFRVAHGVGILTLYQRSCAGGVGGISFRRFVWEIHRAEYVGLAVMACALILHRARSVHSLHHVVGILEVLAVSAFIAERPHYD